MMYFNQSNFMDKHNLFHMISGCALAGVTLLIPTPLAEMIALGSTYYAYRNCSAHHFLLVYAGFMGANLSILGLQLFTK